ncbi:hypothetical protein JG687_00018406, partial [Phytophthora cactorum]
HHSLKTDKRAEPLRLAIAPFTTNNPSLYGVRWVDKDFTEISVFIEELPEARILLCQFHTIRIIQ